MKNYFVIGETESIGERILYHGNKEDCIAWIWNNCDIGDLYNKCRGWSGKAYFDENNLCYTIIVDKFYS